MTYYSISNDDVEVLVAGIIVKVAKAHRWIYFCPEEGLTREQKKKAVDLLVSYLSCTPESHWQIGLLELLLEDEVGHGYIDVHYLY